MPVPFSGGCACAAIRYTCSEEPFVCYACHCTECRKRTGSAFGTSLQVPAAGLAIDRGEPRVRRRTADSGNRIDVRFCGDCGTSVYAGGPARPHVRVIFGGTLDDPGWVPVQANIWTRSALPWVHLDPDVERFEMLPDFARYYENR